MSLGFDLRVMGLLLRQARKLHAFSLCLLGLTGLSLLLTAAEGPFGASRALVLWGGAAAGLVQLYFAVRVDFDAGLFFAAADRIDAHAGDDVAKQLDRSLQSLGLLRADKAGRDWPARWQGARRLLLMQSMCLLFQAGLLVAAWI